MPKEDSKRVLTFANTEDFISFRQHAYGRGEGGEIELKELGPRFELRRKAHRTLLLELPLEGIPGIPGGVPRSSLIVVRLSL